MGFTIAQAFAEVGAMIELVVGPVSIPASAHEGIKFTHVQTAEQMYEACHSLFSSCKIALLAAAVADYRVATPSDKKIKKTEMSGDMLTLELVKNRDILASLGKIKNDGQVLGGFSLETHNEMSFAREKLQRKNCNFIVMNSLNEPGAGFQTDTNKITILTPEHEYSYGLKPKTEVAKDIVNFVLKEYF